MYEYPFLKLYRQLFKPNKGDNAEYKKKLLKFLRNVSNPSKPTLHKIIVLYRVRPNSRLIFFFPKNITTKTEQSRSNTSKRREQSSFKS